jgi:hypothetical protein
MPAGLYSLSLTEPRADPARGIPGLGPSGNDPSRTKIINRRGQSVTTISTSAAREFGPDTRHAGFEATLLGKN